MIAIRNWKGTFETADTRKRERLGWFSCPSGCESRGYRQLMRRGREGLMALGLFQALCQIAATMPARDRGVFRNSDGTGMEPADLWEMTRTQPADFQQALDLLIEVGWILDDSQVVTENLPVPADDLPVICRSSAGHLPQVEGEVEVEVEGKGQEKGEGEKILAGGDLPSGVPAGASKAVATEKVMRRLAWVGDSWQPRLTHPEMQDLSANLSIWEELRDDDWWLLRWWYRNRRPRLVANKPAEFHFPGADRAYLLANPTRCLDTIRGHWQAAGSPKLGKAKAKPAGDGAWAHGPNGSDRTADGGKSALVAEPHPMERLLETDPDRYEALSRAVWEGPLSAVDEIVIRGEKADPALALMRVHDLMAEMETRRQGDLETGSSGDLERGAAA